ncbi:response regulator [Vibrio crassostreae]|uniref:ATP-binding protein n=1 Tax=Vibrio crassostreae TaxID=246167 RepID=UPI00200A5A4C|nr:ATP-binding protein [Vibrio crassostreae]UPR30268.1 response regulator [Vibrio crassostreae]
MDIKYIDNSIKKSNRITLGFLFVVIILTSLGIVAWSSLSNLFISVERYDGASEILLTLDRARLYELSYTRDLSKSDSDQALIHIDEALYLTSNNNSTEKRYGVNLRNIRNELELYRNEFLNYVSLNDRLIESQKSMVNSAKKSSEVIDNIRDIQNGNIRFDTDLVEKLYLEIIDSEERLSLSRNIYLATFLVNKYPDYFSKSVNENITKTELEVVSSLKDNSTNLVKLTKFTKQNETSLNLLKSVDEFKSIVNNIIGKNKSGKPSSSELIRLGDLSKDMLRIAIFLRESMLTESEKAKQKLAEAQSLLSKRVQYSETFISLEENINSARQADRDFSLTRNIESREVYYSLVNSNLESILNTITGIDMDFLGEDEIKLILNIEVPIVNYKMEFDKVSSLTNEISRTSNIMVDAAIKIDSILLEMKDRRSKEMEEASNLAKFISVGGVLFVFSVGLLGYLVQKNGMELRTLTKNLKASNEKVIKSAEVKSQFLAMMSHEIRTPMNAIIGMSYLALQGNLAKKERNYIGKVHYSANLLLGIINDLLDFSKIEAGKLNIESIEFSPSDLIEDFTLIAKNMIKKKEINLEISIMDNVPRILIGDSLRIHQILMNLTSNAIKFTESGSVNVIVDSVESDKNQVFMIISVKDSGIGMTDEQIGNLYTSFNQADSTTTRKYGGTGLGLAITKKLVELMNGTIAVQSHKGEGSKFEVILPLMKQNKTSNASNYYSKIYVFGDAILDVNEKSRAVFGNSSIPVERYYSYHSIDEYTDVIDDVPALIFLFVSRVDSNFFCEISRIFKQLSGFCFDLSVVYYGELESLDLSQIIDTGKEVKIKNVTGDHELMKIMCDFDYKKNVNLFCVSPSKENSLEVVGSRVLVVEDNEINRELIVDILSREGVDSLLANNGKEAIEILKYDTSFDAILMDCQMPVLDGYEATKIIRNDMLLTDIPIIAITANVLKPDRDKAMQAGMVDLIHKPIVVDRMFMTMNKWIKTSQFKVDNTDDIKVYESAFVQIINIDGVDVQKGLLISGNNEDLYLRLLKGFNEQYKNREFMFRDKLTINRDVHTLKGISGNLGFEGIYNKCIDIESSGSSKDVDVLLRSVDREVKKLCSLIDGFSKDNDNIESSGAIIDYEYIESVIGHAKNHDFEAIVSLNSSQGKSVINTLEVEGIREIKRAINEYDFDSIVKILIRELS